MVVHYFLCIVVLVCSCLFTGTAVNPDVKADRTLALSP